MRIECEGCDDYGRYPWHIDEDRPCHWINYAKLTKKLIVPFDYKIKNGEEALVFDCYRKNGHCYIPLKGE